jgi:type II protein arginine methyltransferase
MTPEGPEISGQPPVGNDKWPALREIVTNSALSETALMFVKAVAHKDDLPLRMAKMALVFRAGPHTRDARLLARMARSLAPDDYRIRVLCDWETRREAPLWHFGIIHDQARNEAYARALEHYVRPGMEVFEIGTGTGILAMLAARAGAKHVYTCERRPEVAAAARDIIEKNGLSDRITVIAKDVLALQIGIDMPHRADLFVAELVDNSLLGENVLSLTALARERFLVPDAILLPRCIAAIGCLVSGRGQKENYHMDSVMGFDLTPFNRFSPLELSAGKGGGTFAPLSDPVELASFDLSGTPLPETSQLVDITANSEGTAEGIMRWLRLDFGEGIVFENRPPLRSSWDPLLHVLPERRVVVPGKGIRVEVSQYHDRLFLIPHVV